MSNQTVTATFRSISDEALNPAGEVVFLSTLGEDLNKYFDLLIEVEWLSGPKEGQKGLLLCSHYCKWPQELMNKADFLEGCFTPKEMKMCNRLVLGYHPTTVTSYDWSTLGEVVEISTYVEEQPLEMSNTFQRGGELILPTCRSFRRASRLASAFMRDAEQSGLNREQAFSALEQRFSNGEFPLGINRFLFSYMLNALQVNTAPNARLSTTLVEYGEHCEVNGNTVRVIRNGNGFHSAVSIPLEKRHDSLVVTTNYPQEGFYVASEYEPTLQDWHPGYKVVKTRVCQGFMKPSLIGCLNSVYQMEDEFGTYQQVEGESDGFHYALELPYEWKFYSNPSGERPSKHLTVTAKDLLDYGWWPAVSI